MTTPSIDPCVAASIVLGVLIGLSQSVTNLTLTSDSKFGIVNPGKKHRGQDLDDDPSPAESDYRKERDYDYDQDNLYLIATAINLSSDITAATAVISGIFEEPGRFRSFKNNNSALMFLYLWLEFLESQTGFGDPYRGDNLLNSSQQFSALSKSLPSAAPGKEWQSSAAHAYANRLAAVQGTATALTELDRKLANSAADLAQNIAVVREIYGVLKLILACSMFVEIKLRGADLTSLTAEWFIVQVAALAVAIAMSAFIDILLASSEVTAGRVEKLCHRYQQLTTEQLVNSRQTKFSYIAITSAADMSTTRTSAKTLSVDEFRMSPAPHKGSWPVLRPSHPHQATAIPAVLLPRLSAGPSRNGRQPSGHQTTPTTDRHDLAKPETCEPAKQSAATETAFATRTPMAIAPTRPKQTPELGPSART